MDFHDLQTQTFIGRDLNLSLEVTCTGAELQELWERLLPLLADRSVTIADGVVRVSGAELPVTAAQAQALRAYFEQAPVFDLVQREQCYLLRLSLDPAIRRWGTQYVVLAGGYRPVVSPRFREIRVRGDGPQREIERVPLPDIRDALRRHAHFILLAPPGAGKTTVLQRLALDEAHARLHDPEMARLPLVVRLAEQKADEDPHAFLARLWQRELPGPGVDAAAEFAAALHQGRLCLLCDALNEARRDRLQERIDDWRDFAAALPAGNRLVFTCRTDDYDGRLKVQQVEIDPLDDGQIRQFAAACLHHTQPDAFWSALTGPHADLLPLARTPYYLALLVDEFDAHEELPTQRAQLLERFATKLLSREEDKRHPDWIDAAAQDLALRELAFAMQSLGEGTEVDEAFALAQIPAQVRFPSGRAIPTPGETVLRLGAAATLLARTTDSVKFTHHLLQEYFAAEALLRRWRDGEGLDDLWRVRSGEREMSAAPRGEWDPLPGPPTTRWEQTTALAATLCPELVDSVQPINPALAARCLVEQGPAANPARMETSRRALLARLDSPAVHLRSRIEAGLLLGRLGDPRFAEESVGGVRVILPPLVEVAAAQAQIGTGRWEQGDKDERPRHKVTLAAYALGRYPVTNAEFRCFLDAGGYDPAGAWWTEGGRCWLRGDPRRARRIRWKTG